VFFHLLDTEDFFRISSATAAWAILLDRSAVIGKCPNPSRVFVAWEPHDPSASAPELRFEKRYGYGALKLFEILVCGKDGLLSFERGSADQEIGG